MNDNEKPNGHVPQPAQQVLDVGAIVPIDSEVMKHGVLFTHPQLPPFRLLFRVENGTLMHSFEVIGQAPADAKEASIIMPKNAIIMPPGKA